MSLLEKPITHQELMSVENIQASADLLIHITIIDRSEALSFLAYLRQKWSKEFLAIVAGEIQKYAQNVPGSPANCNEILREYVIAQNEVKNITDKFNSLPSLEKTSCYKTIRILRKSVEPSKLTTAISSIDPIQSDEVFDIFAEFDRIDTISQKLVKLSDESNATIQIEIANLRLQHGCEDFKLAWESLEDINSNLKKLIVLQGIVNGDIPKHNPKKAVAKPITSMDRHRQETQYLKQIGELIH